MRQWVTGLPVTALVGFLILAGCDDETGTGQNADGGGEGDATGDGGEDTPSDTGDDTVGDTTDDVLTDTGEDTETCEDGPPTCVGDDLVSCVDGESITVPCANGCEADDSADHCVCVGGDDCNEGEACILGGCRENPCVEGGDVTACSGDDLVICSDGEPGEVVACIGGCDPSGCLCEGDDECPDEQFCAEDGSCVDDICEAGAASCNEDAVVRCDPRGASEGEWACPSGTCVDGACECADVDECFTGETCTDEECLCASGLSCGERAICCEENNVCVTVEFCEGEDCETDDRCLPPCDDGTRCGPLGELCCEGDTPMCHPSNTCTPDCGEGTLCGDDLDICCPAGDVCAFGECRTPGAACEDFRDCDFEEYCEPLLGQCLPNDFPDDIECRYPYDFGDFAPAERWHWEGVEVDDTDYDNVMSSPMVADMNGDEIPDVVFQAYTGDLDGAILVVIEGEEAGTIYTNATHPIHGAGHVGLANLDDDPYPEIATTLLPSEDGGDPAVGVVDDIVNCPNPEDDDEGCYLWTFIGDTLTELLDGGAPLFADFNGDGAVEVVFGSVVFDGESGTRIVDGGPDSAGSGSFGNQFIPAAADVNEDGVLDLLTGDCAWNVDFENGELDEIWCNDNFTQGFPGVADIDETPAGEGAPEVVVVQDGVIYILRGDNGQGAADERFESDEILYQFDLPGGGHGGPPNIADFDGDGRPEIGTAGIACYTVFDIDCAGSDSEDAPGCDRPEFPDCEPGVDCLVEACEDDLTPNGTGRGILWSIHTQDISSETTGSSVFDFQGDGINEVVYNDECRFYALDGRNGAPFLVLPNSTRTNSEFPVVVDVDGDRSTEIIIPANNDQFSRDCEDILVERPDWFPDCDGVDEPPFCDGGTNGVFAFSDPNGNWVRTRTIWNQHAYAITNINDDASVPATEDRSWERFNTFRANRQGEVPLNAPDPALLSLTYSARRCPNEMEFVATVTNVGTLGLAAGLPVSLYRTDGDPDLLIGTEVTEVPLFPGATTTVTFLYIVDDAEFDLPMTFVAVVNDDGEGGAPADDCHPDSNSLEITEVLCRISGPKD